MAAGGTMEGRRMGVASPVTSRSGRGATDNVVELYERLSDVPPVCAPTGAAAQYPAAEFFARLELASAFDQFLPTQRDTQAVSRDAKAARLAEALSALSMRWGSSESTVPTFEAWWYALTMEEYGAILGLLKRRVIGRSQGAAVLPASLPGMTPERLDEVVDGLVAIVLCSIAQAFGWPEAGRSARARRAALARVGSAFFAFANGQLEDRGKSPGSRFSFSPNSAFFTFFPEIMALEIELAGDHAPLCRSLLPYTSGAVEIFADVYHREGAPREWEAYETNRGRLERQWSDADVSALGLRCADLAEDCDRGDVEETLARYSGAVAWTLRDDRT